MKAEFIVSDLQNPRVTNDTGLRVPLKILPPLPTPSPLSEEIGVEFGKMTGESIISDPKSPRKPNVEFLKFDYHIIRTEKAITAFSLRRFH